MWNMENDEKYWKLPETRYLQNQLQYVGQVSLLQYKQENMFLNMLINKKIIPIILMER